LSGARLTNTDQSFRGLLPARNGQNISFAFCFDDANASPSVVVVDCSFGQGKEEPWEHARRNPHSSLKDLSIKSIMSSSGITFYFQRPLAFHPFPQYAPKWRPS